MKNNPFKKRLLLNQSLFLIFCLFCSFGNLLYSQSGVWTQGANVITSRYEAAGTFYQNISSAYLFFTGGDSNGNAAIVSYNDRYNVFTNTWQRMAPIPVGVYYASSTCLKDSMYVIGGMTSSQFLSEVNLLQKYDINSNTWSNRTNLPVTIASSRVISYQDSLIYSFGGVTNGTSTSTNLVFLYNSFSNSWRNATPLPQTGNGFACSISGDTIVIVGLYYQFTTPALVGLINQTNRSQITWTVGANYPGTSKNRWNASPWGCKGIICGPGSPSGFITTNECYVYSPGLNIWSQQPNIPVTTCSSTCGSFLINGIGKYVVASGLALTPPYSIPNTQIYSDSTCNIIGIKKIDTKLPSKIDLAQNYPNPFNPATKINFSIPNGIVGQTFLSVYDILGREVTSLVNEKLSPGTYEVEWDGSNYPSGVYFYKLETESFKQTKKLILLK